MDVICFGQQGWEVCWTGKQQLLTRLSRRGHRVLYADPEVTMARSPGALASALTLRPMHGALREVEPGLHVLTQHHFGAFSERVNAKLRLLTLRAVARRLGMTAPIALALRPDRLWLMRGVAPVAMAYYAVDEWTGFGGLSDESRRRLRAAEEELLGAVDLAMAVSPRLVERFLKIQPNTFLMENGADVEHFAPENIARAPRLPQLASLGRPIIGFIGQVDERLDQPLLAALARARPQWNIVLAGRVKEGTDLAALADLPNVHLLGYQPYERLPSVLRDLDVCLVPYVNSHLTQSCNPLKVFEYLAAGKPVVSRPLGGLLACRGAVALAETAEEFLSAIESALADPARGRAERLAVAAANSWEARVDVLEARLRDISSQAPSQSTSSPPSSPPPASAPPASPLRRGRLLKVRTAKAALRLDPKDDSVSMANNRYGRGPLSRRQRGVHKFTRLAGKIYYAGRLAVRAVRRDGPVRVRKILVVHRGYLGDTLVFLPTLKALRARFPEARIVVGVQREMRAAPLLHASGDVDEVRALDYFKRGRKERLRAMFRLFAEGYDLLITGVWYSLAAEALFCGAPRCVGLYDGHPLQELLDELLPLDPNLHEADNNLALAEALGATPSRADRVPRLGMDAAVVADAGAALLRELEIPDAARIVILHPGSKRATRRWPAERFAQLAQRLLKEEPDLRIVMTGVANEAPLINSVRAILSPDVRDRAVSAAGKTTLDELVGLLDRTAVVVCNDTGVMHLARARDVPLVALLGPENDRRWGPYPLGAAPAVALRAEVPCAPCARFVCESHVCMKVTAVEDVLREVRRLLGRPSPVALPIMPSAGTTAKVATTLAQGSEQPGDQLSIIERRVTRRSWRELAADGADLPRVSVIVLPEEPADDERVAAMLAAAAAQHYPHTELLLVVPLGKAFNGRVSAALDAAAGAGLPCKLVHADGRQILRSLSTAVAMARGEMVAIATSPEAWPAGRVGVDVATIVRGPRGTGARATALLDLQRGAHGWADVADATWVHDALSDWLWARGALPATLTEPPAAPREAVRRRTPMRIYGESLRSFLQTWRSRRDGAAPPAAGDDAAEDAKIRSRS